MESDRHQTIQHSIRQAAKIADFTVHSLLAIPIAVLVGFLPEALISNAYHNTFFEPFTPMIVLVAIGLAILSSRWIASDIAKWVWVLPLVWFLFAVWELTRSWSSTWDSSGSKWAYAVRELLTPQCGDSECLYELFATTPLSASIAYALTYVFIMTSPPARRFHWDEMSKPSTIR